MTKEIADSLVEKYEFFYKKEIEVQGYNFTLYNYILSDYKAFQDDPLTRELRGLVTHKDEVFLSVPKFFNINELPETEYKNVKLKTIKKIQDKLDGSLITPICVGGDIIMKSKGSFESDQAVLAQEIIQDNPELQFFILDTYANNFQPFFELIGPDNEHVIEYPLKENELRLIMVRDREGHFMDIDKFDYKNKAETMNYTLDEMLEIQKTKKGIEGFVVKFTDETILKIKTLDFFELHKIKDEADSYKVILKRILQEDMDDILSIVTKQKRDKLLDITEVVSKYVVHEVQKIEKIKEETKNQDRKTIAIKYHTMEYFNVLMKSLNGGSIKDELIEIMIAKYNREGKAKEFIQGLKGV